MSVSIRNILRDAGTLLNDRTAVRWPLDERYIHLRNGVRALANLNPKAVAVTKTIGLSYGSKQTVPSGATMIHRVNCNVASFSEPTEARAAIEVIDRGIMDRQVPHWANAAVYPPQKRVVHVILDELDPRTFWVFPPNDGTGRIEILGSFLPDTPAQPARPDLISSWKDLTIAVDEIYTEALTNYTVYRCYLKDAQQAGNAARADAYLQMFLAAVGQKGANEISLSPNTTGAGPIPGLPFTAGG